MFIILRNGRRWDPLIGLMEWIMHSRAFTMSEKHCRNSGKLLQSPLMLPIPKKLQLKHMLELNIMQCSSFKTSTNMYKPRFLTTLNFRILNKNHVMRFLLSLSN